ncbi:hypothetical protein V8G54_033405 [Vigna mungo]|uniref:Uncharacterized protein n=1 Tax=Vigna mungo TaxID=3915 RepID=A0AAQ3RIT1_VIGMU
MGLEGRITIFTVVGEQHSGKSRGTVVSISSFGSFNGFESPYALVATPMLGLSLDLQKCFSTSIVVVLHWKKWYSENISAATELGALIMAFHKLLFMVLFEQMTMAALVDWAVFEYTRLVEVDKTCTQKVTYRRSAVERQKGTNICAHWQCDGMRVRK